MISALRLPLVLILLSVGTAAKAEQLPPVRVIPITKESAARSAAELSAASLIGVPPQGRVVRSTGSNWRNARAEVLENEAGQHDRAGLSEIQSDQAVVKVIKPGHAELVVETYVVPRHSAPR